jgi:hypothetical protein
MGYTEGKHRGAALGAESGSDKLLLVWAEGLVWNLLLGYRSGRRSV